MKHYEKDSFYEEFEYILDNFPKYHTKIFLGDFIANVGRKDICKPNIWNQSLHEIGNDMFTHRYIHKFIRYLLTGKPTD
jgi:hypothetical protein